MTLRVLTAAKTCVFAARLSLGSLPERVGFARRNFFLNRRFSNPKG
jgi:hypothetical protein